MKRTLSAILVAVALLPAAGAARASETDEGKATYDLGRCIARSDRSAAIRLMDRLPLSGEADNLGRLVIGGAAACLGSAPARVSAIALRGAVAQELFIRDFGEFGVQPHRSVFEMAKFDLPIGDKPSDVPPDTRLLYNLADCAVRNDTASIEKLVMSGVGSTRETNVLNSMGTILAACQPKGSQINLSRLELRGLLTQSAYDVAQRYATGELTYHDNY